MSRASVDRGRILMDLSAAERRVLARVAGDTVDALLDTDDPARARLLPDGYRDDPDAAAEFARYTRDDLRRTKLDGIGTVLAAIDETTDARIPLDRDEADVWARVLTDVRVTIAERSDLRTDGDEPADPGAAAVYAWLGGLQWQLVEALDRLERKGRGRGPRYRS